MFEQEYSRANDRIHPRKELLKELEAKWAAEEGQQAEEEEAKVRSFPAWARFVGMAAGILLCVGLGTGAMLLTSRSRGLQLNKTASAPEPVMAEGQAEEEAKILLEPLADMAEDADGAVNEAAGAEDVPTQEAEEVPMLAAAAAEPVSGFHYARDEAEVEDAIRYADLDKGAASGEKAKAAETTETAAYPAGDLMIRDDLMAVFQPTTEQVHVIRYDGKKFTNVFSLTLREKGAQVKRFFWMDNGFFLVREKGGDTELLRFDVTDWSKPRHLVDLTQNGIFLGAAEMNQRLCILSRYEATEQEPLPWVNGERIDYTDLLLDRERASTAVILLTVYDPSQDGFASQQALLAPGDGVAFGHDKLLLWAQGAETTLYSFVFGEEGLALAAQGTVSGTLLSAAEVGEDYVLALQRGDDVEMLTLDSGLNEVKKVTASKVGAAHWCEVYEEGTAFLTADALHWLTASQDKSLAVKGDGFCWLTVEKALVLSADGQLQLVSLDANGITALGTVQVKEGLGLLLEDLSRLAFDEATGRLLIPAGQKVHQYLIDEKGELTPRGTALNFNDHNEVEQRELRCLLTQDNKALIFHKDGIFLCNHNLVRMNTGKY